RRPSPMIASSRPAASSTTTSPIAQPMIQPVTTATTIGLLASRRVLVAHQDSGVACQRVRLGEIDAVRFLDALRGPRDDFLVGLTRDLGVADHTSVSAPEALGHRTLRLTSSLKRDRI